MLDALDWPKNHQAADSSRRKNNTCSYNIPSCRTQYRQMSFFPRSIPDWNGLPQEVVTAESQDCFKSRLNSLL